MIETDKNRNSISLSQNEIDKILSEIRIISLKQTEDVPELEVTQNELDALLKNRENQPEQAKPFERLKQVNIIAGRAKWTKRDIEQFISGKKLSINTNPDSMVEILVDGHFLAYGKITKQGNHFFITICPDKMSKIQ